ncbi:hypothetical protein GN109_11625 [Collimonas pratensis]|uniref:hypothetical protein n=1 Tax=Collimonas pratensis TaxID=279113 RepID=UPI00143D669D|nr:hypothetical protein [Collimonas pratensis]NKI70072.1 hypothetical protein [Collimonas pratensis]
MSHIHTFLAGCSTMAATLAAVFVLTGANTGRQQNQFDEITVGRINVVEPDGTKRMIISNRSQFPGDFTGGKESPRADRNSFAGMLFINDEGNENGGFIYKGLIDNKGKTDASMSLTFDRFRQDQTIQLLHADQDGELITGVIINDVPDYKVVSILDKKQYSIEAEKLPSAEQSAYVKQLKDEGKLGQRRIFLGMTSDQNSALVLNDAKGRPRMKLLVSAKGQPEIQMLDDTGKVSKTIDAASN